MTDPTFPHLIDDGLFDPQLLERVLDDMHELSGSASAWRVFDNANERKLGFLWPHATPAMHELYDAHVDWLPKLADLVGCDLHPDPTMTGAGPHMIPPGGFLNTHVDFNVLNGSYRRANVITYLNPGWVEGDGGELELGRPVCETVPPRFGTTAAFATSDRSWHGHGVTRTPRLSFAFYGYSTDRPAWFDRPRSTVFEERHT